MLREEFEKLTGFFPTTELYAAIEEVYYKFDGTKQEFCKAYVKNRNGIAEGITNLVNERNLKEAQEAKAKIEKLQQEVASLRERLDEELEWKVATPDGIKQEDYDELRSSAGRTMSDEAAAMWVWQETGFQRDRVEIIREIPEREVNRHHWSRPTGRKIDRSPVYDATDYYYVLFAVHAMGGTWTYELHNGELKRFPC